MSSILAQKSTMVTDAVGDENVTDGLGLVLLTNSIGIVTTRLCGGDKFSYKNNSNLIAYYHYFSSFFLF